MLKDRIKVSTTTSGTGILTLGIADSGFKDFSSISGQTYYAITNRNSWEVGLGVVSSGTLSRDQIYDSSNSGNRIDLIGKSTVFVTYPASKAVYLNPSASTASGDLLFKADSGWNSRPLSSGDIVGALGYSPQVYTSNSGIVLSGNNFRMGGTGNLNELRFLRDINIGRDNSATNFNNYFNVAMGFEVGPTGTYKNEHFFNTFIGYRSHRSNFSSSNDYATLNVGIGYETSLNARETSELIAIGYQTANNSSGINRLIVFGTAGQSARLVDNSFFTGQGCGNNSDNISDTIGMGISALNSASIIDNCIAIGNGAGGNARSINWSQFVGGYAGNSSSGTNNTYIGYFAGYLASGNNNLEIKSSGTSSFLQGSNSNKIHIHNIMVGDVSSRRLAIGNVSNSNLNPNATLEILPRVSTDRGLLLVGTALHSANLFEIDNSNGDNLLTVAPNGLVSGVRFAASGGLSLNNGIPSNTASALYASGTELIWQDKRVLQNNLVEVSGVHTMTGVGDTFIIHSGEVILFVSKDIMAYRGMKYNFKSMQNNVKLRPQAIVDIGNPANNFTDSIDGSISDYTMNRNDCLTLVPGASGWYILSRYSEIVDGNL